MKLQVFASLNGSGAFGPRKPAWSSGDVIHVAATVLAAVIAATAMVVSLYGVTASEPILPVDALVLAAAIWFVGRIFRRLVNGL